MITGIHAIFYTKHPKEMYDFLEDVSTCTTSTPATGGFSSPQR